MQTDYLIEKLQTEFTALKAIVSSYSKENDDLKTLVACLEEEHEALVKKLMREEMRSHQLRKTIWALKEKVNCTCDGVLDHHIDCPLSNE